MTRVIDMHRAQMYSCVYVHSLTHTQKNVGAEQMLQRISAQTETDHKSESESPPTASNLSRPIRAQQDAYVLLSPASD